MSISANLVSNLSGRPLLVENIRVSVRPPDVVATSAPTTRSTQPKSSLDQIQLLVSDVKSTLQKAVLSSDSFSDQQSSIDQSLAKISKLLGKSFSLGGADNAVFKGLNRSQIADIKVLSLPTNGAASFAGTVRSQPNRSEVVLSDANRLRTGGQLELSVGARNHSVRFQPGSSVRGIADRINRSNLGVSALVSNDRLKLVSSASSFEASVRPQHVVRTSGENRVSSFGSSQFASVDISNLQSEASQRISGTRDSLSTNASLRYQGDVGSVAQGSASFELSGRIGSATLNISKGESLSIVADRVNALTSTTGVIAEVDGDALNFVSDVSGTDGQVRIANVQPSYTRSVEGVDSSQIDRLDLLSIADGDEVTLSGAITAASESATLTYVGGSGAIVKDSATFTVSGNQGSAQISIVKDEALSDVRDRINSQSGVTGVTASVDSNELRFKSIETGSSQSIHMTLDDITQYVEVDGVNGSQVSGFQVVSSQPRSTNVINANVTSSATGAELIYNGFLGATTSAATFTLTGELGSVEIQTNAFASLNSVRDSINAVTGQTGVTASVSGSQLTLESASVGSNAIIDVQVQSGSFNTSGGDGNGNAVGTDAELTINGNAVTASGNSVNYVDALGSYVFDVQQGFVGSIDSITVTTSDGQFEIVGGDAAGTAVGSDATATINGQSFVADGDEFDLAIGSANVIFDVVQNFVGSLSPVTLRSDADSFTVLGGDGNGFDQGSDSVATIDGTQYTSNSNKFDITTSDGNVELTFAEGFVGQFDDILISSDASIRRRTGFVSVYKARSQRPTTSVNGQSVRQKDGRFEFQQDGVRLSVKFASGFNGTFDPFTVRAGGKVESNETNSPDAITPLEEQSVIAIEKAISGFFKLASGDRFSSERATSFEAHSIAQNALSSLQSLTGSAPIRGRSLLGISIDTFA